MEQERALIVFPDAEDDEGNGGGGGPKFGVARNFGFGFLAEELGGDEEGEKGPARQRNRFDPHRGNRLIEERGALQSPD